MSFIGDIAGGYGAKQLGKYNNSLLQTQSKLEKAEADRKLAVWNQLDKPRLIENQDTEFSDFFVKILKSGAEFRAGETGALAALKFKVNQAYDLSIGEYNSKVDYQNQINQSLMTSAKGEAELYKGKLAFQSGLFKAIGTMGGNYYKTGSLLG